MQVDSNEKIQITNKETTEVKPKMKMCCACPETKRKRDDCIAENGIESCENLVELHKACLRSEGFKV